MPIENYLDATYLKTAIQANISVKQNEKTVEKHILQAVKLNCKLVMIRPEFVKKAKQILQNNKILVGTVINFPEGTATLESKIAEAKKAIKNGADELDFVLNYQEFKSGNSEIIKQEVLELSKLGLNNKKTLKFIIETAALNNQQIIKIAVVIKNTVIANFKESCYPAIFVKTSTGFYPSQNQKPTGATRENVIILLENASPLPIKAAGGVKTLEEAIEMLSLGVKRIGTSNAFEILNHKKVTHLYY